MQLMIAADLCEDNGFNDAAKLLRLHAADKVPTIIRYDSTWRPYVIKQGNVYKYECLAAITGINVSECSYEKLPEVEFTLKVFRELKAADRCT